MVSLVLAILAPGQGSQTPGFLAPWLDVPRFAERMAWLSTVAGLDLVRYGTTGDADEIRDTAVAQPLIVAAGLVSLSALFPHPTAGYATVGVAAGHSVGEITAAAGAGVISAEAAMVFVRERGRAMAAASAITPTGMTAILGGDREEVLAKLADARPHRRQRQRRRPDRRRRHPRPARGLRGGRTRRRPA